MGLLNTANPGTSTMPAFESEEEHNPVGVLDDAPQVGGPATQPAATQPAATQPAATQPAATQPAATQAQVPAVQPSYAVGAFTPANAIEKRKNLLRVKYNTLSQLMVTQGNFMDRETRTVLGDEIIFELESYQDSYVISPEDDKAPKEVVRYSDDGVTCSDGTTCADHLYFLHTNGYPKARIKERCVVVGTIVRASKSNKFDDETVQIDLSPASKAMWDRYLIKVATGLRRNKLTEEQACTIRASAQTASKGTNVYTFASFSVAD